jgi:YD repeat-containing protein
MKFRNKELINDENGVWTKNVEGFPFKTLKDDKGRVIREEDAFGNWEIFTYDTRGYIVLTESYWKKKHSFHFVDRDENGRRTFEKWGDNITTLTYTPSGKPKTEETNFGCWKKWEYDENENEILCEWADPSRHVRSGAIYDSLNRKIYSDYEVVGKGTTWTTYEYKDEKDKNGNWVKARLINSSGLVQDHTGLSTITYSLEPDEIERIKEEILKKRLAF